MAYEKHEWVCGETITADLLNHMEEGIAEGGGGGCDCGFECTETETVILNESVTTAAQGGVNVSLLSTAVTADEVVVTFNGTEYECQKKVFGQDFIYGAENPADFSQYPFAIDTNNGTSQIITENAGTHSVKVAEKQSSVNLSDCFIKAVQKAMDLITVTFIDDGHCGDGKVTVFKVPKGVAVGSVTPAQPSCSNYTFRGWRKEGETTDITFPYTVTEDVTFHSNYQHVN